MILTSPTLRLSKRVEVSAQLSTLAFVLGLAVNFEFGRYLFLAVGPFNLVFEFKK